MKLSYFIVLADGRPCVVSRFPDMNGGAEGLLVCDSPHPRATAFGTRKEANAAIRRSQAYAELNRLPWARRTYRVVRVVVKA